MESNSYWESLKSYINGNTIHTFITRQEILALNNVKASTTADYYRNLLEKVGYLGKTNKPGIYCILKHIPSDLTAQGLRLEYENRFKISERTKESMNMSFTGTIENTLRIKYFRRKEGNGILEVLSYDNDLDKFLVNWYFGALRPFKVNRSYIKDFVPISKEEVEKILRQRCPRRDESVFGLTPGDNIDGWEEREKGLLFCSFCGSLHPDSVIKLLKDYGLRIIEPSTKNYKFYLNVKGKTYKYYRQHDTELFSKQMTELLNKI